MNLNPQPLACFSAILFSVTAVLPALAGTPTFTPNITTELRYFTSEPAYNGQLEDWQASLVFSGEGRWLSDSRKQRVRFVPFLRIDNRDDERTHIDIRELSYAQRFNDFDILLGYTQIYWGVTESHNVVDIINQADTVEDNDADNKLGQPLLRLGKFTDIGRLEAYYLPYFRERTFPGTNGRLRNSLVVNSNQSEYERSSGPWAGDIALRYKHQIDDFDIGAHVFYGTARAPFLQANTDGSAIIPTYQSLRQTGVDIQWTLDTWLLKFEGVEATQNGNNFVSLVTGFEYTFFDIAQSGIDAGLVFEIMKDNRDPTKVAATLFDNDTFTGTRVTWNNIEESELLLGAIRDRASGSTIGSVSYETRVGDDIKIEVIGQYFSANDSEPLAQFTKDNHVVLKLTKYL